VVTHIDGQVRLTSFETGDQPQRVLDYYEDILIKEGWQSAGSSATPQTAQTPQALYFDWYAQNGTGGWVLYLTVRGRADGKTDVQLKTALDPGR
jgi:hypothetical protein